MTRQELLPYRKAIVKGAKSLSDEDAVTVPLFYDAWEENHEYEKDDRITYGTGEHGEPILWKVREKHTSQATWTPDVTPVYYTQVGKPEQGDTPDNPIPYNNNMELIKDKYYSQNDVVYVCFRDTEIPVYNDLADLVHIYVEVYEGGEGE